VKLARIGPAGAERPVAIDDDGAAHDLTPVTADIDGAFLGGGGIDEARRRLRDLPVVEIEGQRIGPPVARPNAIVCIGMNYADHAAEIGAPIPERPVVFAKATSTLVGPDDDVVVPAGSTTTDYEVELAVILGAGNMIAGYAVVNDVSERELQLELGGGQWYLGKSCPTFNPLGPWLVPADEVPDPQALALSLSVNGVERQSSTTAQMVFGVEEIVRYLSRHLILEPGDVINTGTPGGVALARPDKPYLRDGDVVELTIAGLGMQRQRVVQG
jgi:2-keto-4-pentenoate hydratase/2-oxohepta-3-ene-1,7-dioic acid hydratase in catechol pathway